MPNSYKKISILIIIVLVATMLGALLLNMRFRVIKTTPDIQGVVSTSFNGFRLEFNRDLATNVSYMEKLDDPAKHIANVEVYEKSLLVIVRPHLENKRYQFAIKDVQAKDGSLIDSVEFDYVTKYIDTKKLSEDERLLIDELSNHYKKDNPIIQYLPHSNLDFKIEAEFDHAHESAQIGDLYLKVTIYLTAADVKTNREAVIETSKKSAQDYIVSIGFNPDDYHIEYKIIEPSLY